MPRFVRSCLTALLAAPVVAGSQVSSGLNALHPFKSRAASASSSTLRHLTPAGFSQVGQSLFGAPPSNAADHAEFGMAVDLSKLDGSALAVGSPTHDWSTSDQDTNFPSENGGAVFLYKHNGTDWNLHWFATGAASEEIGDRVSLSESGTRIAIRRKDTSPHYAEVFDIDSNGAATQVGSAIVGVDDGNTVTLSADGTRLALSSESFTTNTGRVEIFDLVSGSWTPLGSFDGVNAQDRFGWITAFSNDGNRLAISSPNYDNGLSNRGLVRVFEYDSGSWSQLGADLEGTHAEAQLGFSMDLSGDGTTLVVGSPNKDGSGTEKGTVGVYQLVSGVWTLQGSEIEGTDDNDRFGRSVSVSDDGSRIAASSYIHDTQTGQVRLFEMVGGVWSQLGADIDGEAQQDRFGYGILSVTMTGDGVRLASGSTRGDDSNGFSTGRVRVFDGPALPTPSPSQVPSLSPSETPSLLPSAVPSLSPSALPSIEPSAGPSSYLDLNIDKFSWDIFRLGDAVVAFDDESDTEEIMFNYNISRRDNTVVIYEDDCLTPVPDSVVGVAKSLTPTSPSHGTLDVDLDIKQDSITSSDIWEDGPVGVGYISLCIRVDLLLDDVDQTSVHFHETKIVLTIDLTQGFTISEVLDLDRIDAGELAQNANLGYNVFACQCDSTLTCLNQVLTQGDDVYICLETNATNVVFVGIDSLNFVQGSLSRAPITNGNPDALTAMSFNGDRCNIRTQMTSAFFVDDDPADVLASGVAVMAFTDTGRQLRANIVYRDLEEAENNNVDFNVDLGLDSANGSGATSKKMASMALMALGGVFVFA